jgi:hypothetical protein
MVGRISPQTPEAGTHQHRPETPRTAHHSLRALSVAPARFNCLLFSYSYESLFSQLLYFHIHPNPPGGCTPPPSSGSFRCIQRPASSVEFSRACRLFGLFCGPSPFVFNGLQPLFAKHPGGGVCPQTRHLKSTRCRLFACALPPLSGPGEGRAQSTAHYPQLTTHFPVRPHSVLDFWLSCPEAGQP